jgi:hypothetical protein
LHALNSRGEINKTTPETIPNRKSVCFFILTPP